MTTRTRWEARYQATANEPIRPASFFLQEQIDRLPRGRALDIACGNGRNTIFLARHGFVVEGIDIAAAGLRTALELARREQLPIRLIQADLENFPLPDRRYDTIVNIRYLHRPLFAALKAALRPGGLLLCETFLISQREFGPPTDPSHLLDPGELHRIFHDFEFLVYEERLVESETGPAHLARMLARRPSSWKAD